MKKLSLFTLVAAAALLALPGAPKVAFAQSGASEKPLRGVVRLAPRRGGYSYTYLQGTNTRKFVDPTVTSQTRAGPFDSGFFFSSPAAGRNGGDSPYMQ